MSAINKIIHNWNFHTHGGYYTKEILDGDLLREAIAELARLQKIEQAAINLFQACSRLTIDDMDKLEKEISEMSDALEGKT